MARRDNSPAYKALTATIWSLLDKSGHAMRRLGQVNAAGRPYAAPN